MAWRAVSAVADDALAENGAISRHHKRREGRKDGVIDYGNIFSVEAKVKQHTSRRPSPREPSFELSSMARCRQR